MCVVSMVMDQWWPKNPWGDDNPFKIPPIPPITVPTAPNPAPIETGTIPATPNSITWPTIQQDPKLAEMMLDVLNKLEAIDKRMGLMEQCLVEASEKKKVKAKLRRIAKKTVKKKKAKKVTGLPNWAK